MKDKNDKLKPTIYPLPATITYMNRKNCYEENRQ
jgi:hypothetical protein